MNQHDLLLLGIPEGESLKLASQHLRRLFAQGLDQPQVENEFRAILANPEAYRNDPATRPLVESLTRPPFTPRESPAPWEQWGSGLEEAALVQMRNAASLPVAVSGALMPDAHVGYGLPIGGVLATDRAVIPYAVGVDIACRMKLTVYHVKAKNLAGMRDRAAKILEDETRFGIGCEFRGEDRRDHPVMDEDWSITPVTKQAQRKAWGQLGTSGSGNHFVEFGAFTPTAADELGLPEGEYLALLSHSGSRGSGAQVCDFYSRRAMDRHPNLPRELKHLAWLSLDEADGQEYWAAMELMGRYASANHELIHRHITRRLGFDVALQVENHHNFAWKETHLVDGAERELIVHRKGATPAGEGVLGIIPGSMATPGYLVRGKGVAASLHSASHGAGRAMSRKKALESFAWSHVRKQLAAAGVELLSAGLDEVPGVYKDIETVMNAQTELVDTLGRFDPRLVKMCPAGDRAED